MTTVKLNFFNQVSKPTSNQILIFLQPTEVMPNQLYSAWNVLNPSIGSTQTAVLTNEFSGSIATFGDSRGNYNQPVALPLGKALTITNPNDQSPVIGLPGDEIDPSQVGLQNEATTPPTKLSVTWYVNNKRVVETNNTNVTTLNPGFKSTFQMKQSVFLFLGQKPIDTQTYTIQTISKSQEFPIPNDATELNFEVFTDKDGVDKFRLLTKQAFDQLVTQAIIFSKMYKNPNKYTNSRTLGPGQTLTIEPLTSEQQDVKVINNSELKGNYTVACPNVPPTSRTIDSNKTENLMIPIGETTFSNTGSINLTITWG